MNETLALTDRKAILNVEDPDFTKKIFNFHYFTFSDSTFLFDFFATNNPGQERFKNCLTTIRIESINNIALSQQTLYNNSILLHGFLKISLVVSQSLLMRRADTFSLDLDMVMIRVRLAGCLGF